MTYLAALVDIGFDPPLRLSSFDRQVTVDGKTYEGGRIASWGPVQNQTGSPSRRATVSVHAVDGSARAVLLSDHGPVDVEIRFAARADDATEWTLLPKRVAGKLSATQMTEGRADLTIETAKGTTFAGRVLVMSDSMQRELYPSPTPDRGFEYSERFRDEGILERPPPQ